MFDDLYISLFACHPLTPFVGLDGVTCLEKELEAILRALLLRVHA